MPRSGIPYDKTWIYLLKQDLTDFDIIDRPMRGGTTNRLVTEGGGGIDLLELYNPDFVIIQMGHSECAPRLFKKTGPEHFFMHRVLPKKYLQKYISFIKRRRPRLPERTDIEHQVTEKNIRSYIQRCGQNETRLIYIKILKPTNLYISKSPFISQNVEKFNRMLENFASEYDFVTVIEPIKKHHDINSLCVDEMHINPEGHMIYYMEISRTIKQFL